MGLSPQVAPVGRTGPRGWRSHRDRIGRILLAVSTGVVGLLAAVTATAGGATIGPEVNGRPAATAVSTEAAVATTPIAASPSTPVPVTSAPRPTSKPIPTRVGAPAPTQAPVPVPAPAPAPTPKPSPKPVPKPTTIAKPPSTCHPSYTGGCVPYAKDVDCAGGTGDGPVYVRGPLRVVGEDVYGLDGDNDKIACEAG